jgi:N-acetyl sugar amidotransferase
MNQNYQMCARCIIDTNDYPEIEFDKDGVCSVCHIYDETAKKMVKKGEEADLAIKEMVDKIKTNGKGKEYDCLIGVSGGVDSTYLCLKAKEWGLKPLIIHVDNGWDTELSTMNIENIIKKLGFDLYTYVIDWNELKDLQLSYLKASVLDIDVTNENAYAASVFNVANEKKIKYILTGHNVVTEGWMPPTFTHFKYDIINMKAIHKKFGNVPLKTYPFLGVMKAWYFMKIKGFIIYNPLNWIKYEKTHVKDVIQNELGWRDYGGKHFENIYTRFYQGYILYKKFRVDKRKSHLSTLICSGQMTKEDALTEIKNDPYPNPEILQEDREYFIKKIGISESEFLEIMSSPLKSHLDYPSILHWYARFRPYVRFLKKVKGKLNSR